MSTAVTASEARKLDNERNQTPIFGPKCTSFCRWKDVFTRIGRIKASSCLRQRGRPIFEHRAATKGMPPTAKLAAPSLPLMCALAADVAPQTRRSGNNDSRHYCHMALPEPHRRWQKLVWALVDRGVDRMETDNNVSGKREDQCRATSCFH